MRVYAEFAKKAFQRRLAYKTDAVLTIGSRFLRLFVVVNVWQALYRNRDAMDGITLPDMLTFAMVGMFVQSLTYTHMDRLIATKLEDGSIVCDLVKPIRFKYFLLADYIGENVHDTVLAVLPACLFGAFYWGFRLPEHPVTFAAFIVTLAGGIVLMAQLNYVLGLLAFWFKTSMFIDWLFMALRSVFAGLFVPLWFYPPFLRGLSECMPWRLGAFSPIAVLLEKTTGAETLRIILFQALWIGGLVLAERFLWRRALLRTESFGG